MDMHALFSLNEHLEALSQHGDPLEVLEQTVDFEYFRSWLVEWLEYGDGSRGSRPPLIRWLCSKSRCCRPSTTCPIGDRLS